MEVFYSSFSFDCVHLDILVEPTLSKLSSTSLVHVINSELNWYSCKIALFGHWLTIRKWR